MSTIGERMRHVRENMLRIRQGELANMLGFKRIATISDYEKNKRCPDIETLCKLAELSEVSIEWLLTGKSTPVGIHKDILKPQENSNLFSEKDLLINVYDQSSSAPFGQFPSSAPVMSMCVCKTRINEGYVAYVLRDDSMSPIINNGAIVCINTKDRAITEETLFAVYQRGEGVSVRKLRINGNFLELIPENRNFNTQSVPLDNLSNDLIIGRIKWVYQNF